MSVGFEGSYILHAAVCRELFCGKDERANGGFTRVLNKFAPGSFVLYHFGTCVLVQ